MMRDRGALLGAIAALEALPPSPEHRIVLAEAEFRVAVDPATEPAEAIDRLRRAIRHDPFPAKLHLHLGRLLHRDGRQRAAVPAYRQAVRLAPGSRRAHLLLALALLDLDAERAALGRRLLVALAAGDDEARAAVLRALDTPGAAGKARIKDPIGSTVDTWRPGLLDQLARPRFSKANVDAHVGVAAADGPAAYVTACALLLVGGESADGVRRLLTGADLDAAHPAVRMLHAALDLAGTDDPDARLTAMVAAVRQRVLPAQLAWWLFYVRYRADPPPLPATAGMLAAIPFPELRIAILDDHARRAWADGQFGVARLLWHEMLAIDPYRVPVALNLALHAARTRAADEYGPAWEHLAETLYLHSAGLGELRAHIDDRITLHLALSQQSAARHPGTGPGEPAAWVEDRAALDVWLREWDLYYLNRRLRFRSPVHVLGIARDATPEQLDEAHQRLRRHLGDALDARRWAGAAVFRDLARARADEARRTAADPDPHHDAEQAEAAALLDEALDRVLALRQLGRWVVGRRSAALLPLGAAVAGHQFALPLATLTRRCVERGVLEDGETLAGVFGGDLAELAAAWDRPKPAGAAQVAERLAALDACVAAAPELVAVRLQRCRLLQSAGREQEALAGAVEALALPYQGLEELVDAVRGAFTPEQRTRLPRRSA